jgi:hypothetical protein
MENIVRIGAIEPKTYRITQRALGLTIEKRGTGLAGGTWLPALTLIFGNEPDAIAAERHLDEVMKTVIAAE